MDANTNFRLAVNEAAQHRRAADLLIREAAREVELANAKAATTRGARFSIVRAVSAMTAEGGAGLHDGIEAEIAQEAARLAGRPHDPSRIVLPWSTLLGARTLTVGTDRLTVGTDVPAVADALAPWSVTLRAGISVLPNLVGDVRIPRESTTGTGQWLASETGTGTAAELALGAVALKAKNALGYMQISGRLLRQGPLADDLVARSLRRALGSLVDQAIIAGTSTDESVPLGVRYQPGVTVTTGTSLSYATLLNEQEQIALGNVQDGNHAWVGHPTVRKLLAARDVGTNSGRFLWDYDRVLNRPAYVTTDVGTGRIVHGDWSQVVLGLWGPGFVVEHNPYAGFASNTHGFRVVVACDVGLFQPSAVRVLTGIT